MDVSRVLDSEEWLTVVLKVMVPKLVVFLMSKRQRAGGTTPPCRLRDLKDSQCPVLTDQGALSMNKNKVGPASVA